MHEGDDEQFPLFEISENDVPPGIMRVDATDDLLIVQRLCMEPSGNTRAPAVGFSVDLVELWDQPEEDHPTE